MMGYSSVDKDDLLMILSDKAIPWPELNNKTILVTGATGLIGTAIVKALIGYGKATTMPMKLLLWVRNKEKGCRAFDSVDIDSNTELKYVVGDIQEEIEIPEPIHYIIHAASETASSAFVSKPVETINIAAIGTKNVLRIAQEKHVQKMVYLSSMEVYGHPSKGTRIQETDVGAFDSTNIRNSYPIAKQICESLCCAYAAEYQVPVCIARLTQTFGPGVEYNDGRVFAEFMRCALEKRNIVLKTKGETERSYLYTADAVRAILLLLLKGASGEAYSVANENTYCSILQMANMVAETLADGEIHVEIQQEDIKKYGLASTLFMNLDTTKIQQLGWKPMVDLPQMYIRMKQGIG